jgi:hypothetical protein
VEVCGSWVGHLYCLENYWKDYTMSGVYRRSKKSSPVYGKVIGGRHLTLPFDGKPKLVVTTKKCSCCDEDLVLSKFYPESASKGGGVRRMCRDCWDQTNGRLYS